MPQGGGPYQVGTGSMQTPGGMTPQQRTPLFPGQPAGTPPGVGPMGGEGAFNPFAFLQAMLGAGTQPQNEVKKYAQNLQNLGRDLTESMEDTWNLGSFLGNVFKV